MPITPHAELERFRISMKSTFESIDAKPSRILYHYTKNEALIGMIQKPEVWATHIRFLNDPNELFHGYTIAWECAKIISQAYPKSSPVEKFLKLLENPSNIYGPINLYVVSLSEKRDDLSQWRGYGDKYKSVCIGFNLDTMEINSDSSPNIMNLLMKVIYDPIDQIDLLNKFFNGYFDCIKNETGDSKIDNWNRNTMIMLLQILTRFKHFCWKDESEWRLVFLDEEVAESNGNPAKMRKKYFRPGSTTIIPFVKANIYPDKMDIAEIILPHHDLFENNKKSVCELLVSESHKLNFSNITKSICEIMY